MSYQELEPYAPHRPPCAIDLSDNTNQWGAPPSALRIIQQADSENLARYPAAYPAVLESALAAYIGVDASEIATGCGSDDVLDCAMRALAEPGSRVAYSDPSFAMVPIFARVNGLEPVAVPLAADLDIDADALLATGAAIIYICSPNNPTGMQASAGAVRHVIAGAPGFVIIDEAYAEFQGGGFAAAAPEFDNVLVTRTLSKAFGLAGLRVGYATGCAGVMTELAKSRGPYKVNGLAERAAVAVLQEDRDWVAAVVREVRAIRDRFLAALAADGVRALPSAANFVLVPVRDALATTLCMREDGVAVRPFSGLRGIGDAVRITIGPWSAMDAALRSLRRIRACA